MNLFDFSEDQILLFLLIFTRIGSLILFAPILGSIVVPSYAKIGLAFFISIIIFPLLDFKFSEFPKGVFSFAILIGSEVAIGIVIGFSIRLLLSAVQLAGTTIGFQMGFGIVNVIDPVSSIRVSIIAQFQNILAFLIFLSINAHYVVFNAIVTSFHLIPPLGFEFNGKVLIILMSIVKDLFVIAIQIAAPVIASLLFTSVALGMIARTVPQMNVFIVGFPLQIGLGLFMIGLTLPLFGMTIKKISGMIEQNILLLLHAM